MKARKTGCLTSELELGSYSTISLSSTLLPKSMSLVSAETLGMAFALDVWSFLPTFVVTFSLSNSFSFCVLTFVSTF